MWTCDVERPWWSLLLWWTINNMCALMHHLACRVQVRWQGKPDLLSELMYCAEEFSEEWTRWLGVDGPTLAYWMLELNVRGEADALAEKCKNSDKVYFFTFTPIAQLDAPTRQTQPLWFAPASPLLELEPTCVYVQPLLTEGAHLSSRGCIPLSIVLE